MTTRTNNTNNEMEVTFRITYTRITIDGYVTSSSKWFDSLDEIPSRYWDANDAKLITRILPKVTIPSYSDFMKKINK